MDLIDKASLIDKKLGTVKTDFGITGIKNLSTGCKTVLVFRYLQKRQMSCNLNINECGWNAVKVLFAIVLPFLRFCTNYSKFVIKII